MEKERLDYIDILKGIGILFVIFSHSGAEKWFMSYFGDFFVSLFFIASGYTYIQRDTPFITIIKKRARRLLFPYVFFSILLLILYKRFSLIDIFGVFYSRYCLYPFNSVSNVYFLGGGNPPLWFLTSMLTAFIPFWLLMKYSNKTMWILSAFVLITYGFQFLPILLPWSLDTACLTGVFLYVGNLSRRFEKQLFKWPIGGDVILISVFVVVCILNGSDNLSVREYGNSFFLYFIACVCATWCLLRLSKLIENSFLCKMLINLGRHSLVIFCIQMFLLRICHQVFHDIMHLPTEGLGFYGITVVKILIVAFAGMFISKLMTRFLPWLFK